MFLHAWAGFSDPGVAFFSEDSEVESEEAGHPLQLVAIAHHCKPC